MSNVGQAALTVVGLGIGFFTGNMALGLYIGNLAGQALFPTKLPGSQGPRLGELNVQASTIGAPIPRVYGTFALAGNVIWTSGLKEIATTEEVGGKGGPTQSQTTYEYTVSLAIGICEREMAGVKRIWADTDLIYDATLPPGEDSPGNLIETILLTLAAQIAGNEALRNIFEFYPGNESQLPDPTIESYEGVGNVPAYRGLCYAVFRDFNVTKYGNRIPNFRFEVFEDGEELCEEVTENANEELYPWINADYPINPANLHEANVKFVPWPGPYGGGRGSSFKHPTVGEALAQAVTLAEKDFPVYSGYTSSPDTNRSGRTAQLGYKAVGQRDSWHVTLFYSQIPYDLKVKMVTGIIGDLGPGAGFTYGMKWWSNNQFAAGHWGGGAAVYVAQNKSLGSEPPVGWDRLIFGGSAAPYNWILKLDAVISVTRVPRPPATGIEKGGVPLVGSEDWSVMPDGSIESNVPWTRVDTDVSQQARVLQRYNVGNAGTPDGISIIQKYPLSPAVPFGDPNYSDEAFWTAAYNEAVAAGDMEAGLTWNVDYPVTQRYYYTRTYDACFASSDEISLATIVDDLSRLVGINDADVSDLVPIMIKGYAITRSMSARDGIEPLRSYGFFDAVESNGIPKFVTRGKAEVATLTADDLAAHDGKEQRPTAYDVTRGQDVELPLVMRVHYANPLRDYEPGEQKASRLTTRSRNLVDLELAISMADDKAAQIAEVLLYEAWTARMAYRFSLGLEWLHLDPADVVLLPVGDKLERVRIQSISYSPPSLLSLDAVRDDAAVYDSSALGIPGQGTGSAFNYVGPTELVLLDIPTLRDADDDPGFYAAMRPLINVDTWRGAALYRSADGGASFSMIGASTSSVIMGQLTADSGSAPATITDDDGELLVQVFNGTLESRTEDAVLAGANAAAIGAHGRWEIVQFKDAELIGTNTWRLTSLRRGRRGTEHNIGAAAAGDSFVFLSGGGLFRVYQEPSAINASRTYKAITFGANLTPEDVVQDFAGAAVALKPFSPVFVDAVREDDGDVRVTWIRRGRLSQELRDGADIPLSESVEAYEVDVLDGATVLRTLNTSVQQVTYTLAQQLADFGSPVPASLEFRVYQMSSVVGRGYPASATIILETEFDGVGPSTELDAEAIVVTGETKDSDELDSLAWVVQGSNTRRSDRGFVGDGYQFRLVSTASTSSPPDLPTWLASGSGQAITLRATVEPYWGVRHATADRLVTLCDNDGTANPKLELAIVSDPTDSDAGGFMVAARAFTGSMQTQRIARTGWRYHWQFPIKTLEGYRARPQAVCHLSNGTVLVSAHYENNFSQAYQCEPGTGGVVGSFRFDPVTAYHVNSIARRASDDTIWFDGDDRILRRLDAEASVLSGNAVVTGTFDCTAMAALSGIEWVEIEGEEYLLLGEYLTAGTPYIYVIAAADVISGGTFVLGDRVKRMASPLRCQGFAYLNGILWLSCSVAPAGGRMYPVLLDDFLADGTDGASYTGYLERPEAACPRPPTAYAEDVKFDPTGRLWMITEGLSAVDDADEFLCVWSSEMDGAEENTYQLRYDGAGSVEIKVNDRLFVTRSWTPNVTPAAISILGPPTGASSQTGGFACARVWNVVVQEPDLNLQDYSGQEFVYSNVVASRWQVPLLNADASEEPGSEWTVVAGELARQINGTPFHRGQGEYGFMGGLAASSIVTQRINLLASLPEDYPDIETSWGQLWFGVEWLAASWPAQSDRARVTLRFYDVADSLLATSAAPDFTPNQDAAYIYRSWGAPFPAGTQSVEVEVDMLRTDGTDNNGHWDDLRLNLYGAQS